MVDYIIKRELVKPEIFPKEEKLVSPKEGEKFVYSVDIKYGVQNTDSEKIDFDQNNSASYQNFIDYSSLDRFLSIIKKRKSPSEKFPIIELTVQARSVPASEYPSYDSSRLYSILEKKVVDGKLLEDKIYEYPIHQFIRNPWFCDIIKGYDYEVF